MSQANPLRSVGGLALEIGAVAAVVMLLPKINLAPAPAPKAEAAAALPSSPPAAPWWHQSPGAEGTSWQSAGPSTVPAPTMPEPTMPEPTMPEPTMPEPTMPEPTMPAPPVAFRALPPATWHPTAPPAHQSLPPRNGGSFATDDQPYAATAISRTAWESPQQQLNRPPADKLGTMTAPTGPDVETTLDRASQSLLSGVSEFLFRQVDGAVVPAQAASTQVAPRRDVVATPPPPAAIQTPPPREPAYQPQLWRRY
jgi:hypothetical protein